MLALGFTLILALFWTIVGRASFAVCRSSPGILRSWLLSPALGVAVSVLCLMAGSQAGVPIERFATPLFWVLGLGAAIVLAASRPVLPVRAMLPFVLAAIAFVIWGGWPMFHRGFHWTAYVNDDYLNYCLAAERFRHFGFYRTPTVAELAGRDYSQYYWFMHALELMRFGAEHVVAWIASLLGLRAVFAFMPAILALGVAQIGAAAGLVLHRGRWRRAAQGTAILLAFSPLFLFGVVYQLIAQVGGLALALAFIALATRRWSSRHRGRIFGAALPLALVGAALAVFYPEVSPFAWLAILVTLAGETLRHRRVPGTRIVQWLYTLVVVLVLLRFNLISYIYTLAGQFNSGIARQDPSLALFPFFLLPSGLSALFGFQSITSLVAEPWGSFWIAMGAALLVVAAVASVRLVRRGEPVGALLAGQLLMAAMLFRNSNDFGLYKLAMYLQPALIGGLAWAGAARGGRFWPRAAGVAYLACILPAGWHAVRGSVANQGVVVSELTGSAGKVAALAPLPDRSRTWAAGLDNLAGVKFAADAYRGANLRFLDRDYFPADFRVDADYPLMWAYPHRDLYPAAHELLRAALRSLRRPEKLFGSDFYAIDVPGPLGGYLAFPGLRTLFNKFPAPRPAGTALLDLVPASGAENFGMFIDSSRGNLYYLGKRARIGLFQREYDPFQPAGGLYGIGSFLLIRVQNASPEVYVRLQATKSLKGPGATQWQAGGRVRGENAAPLPVRGDGAINVIAGPVRPVRLDGAAYVALEFQEPATRFADRRTGLNRLYHLDIPFDYRRIVAYARDISVLAPGQVARLAPPAAIDRFPGDLVMYPELQYAGLYEDGWVSAAAFVELAPGRAGGVLRLRGYVPRIAGRTAPVRLRLKVNGQPLPAQALEPGPFDWLLPASGNDAGTRLEIACADPLILPDGDDRPVALKLLSAAVVSGAGRLDFTAGAGAMPLGAGVEPDGWTKPEGFLALPAPRAATRLQVEVEYPDWGTGPRRNPLRLQADDGPVQSEVLTPGRATFTLAVTPGPSVHRLRLWGAATVALPKPDTRRRSFRLISAAFLP